MRPHLYKRSCPLVGRSVRRLVGPSVMLSSKSLKNGLLRILNDLDSAGRGKHNAPLAFLLENGYFLKNKIFFNNIFIFSLRLSFFPVPPSSPSLLPLRPSFLLLLVPLSSSSLFSPRPALSKSFRICKSPFFIDFDESITNRPTDRPTDGPTDRRTDGRARHLMEMRGRI